MSNLIIDVGEMLGVKEITVSEAGQLKKELVDRLADQPIHTLVLDLQGIRQMDSSGLGVLVTVYKLMKAKGGNVSLFGPQPKVKSILDVTRVSQVIGIIDELPSM